MLLEASAHAAFSALAIASACACARSLALASRNALVREAERKKIRLARLIFGPVNFLGFGIQITYTSNTTVAFNCLPVRQRRKR